jgi:hypothetical protein
MSDAIIIRPEIFAAKLDVIRAGASPALCQQALEHRQLPELICYLARYLSQPGGADKLAHKIVDTSPGRLGPAIVRALAGQKSEWTLEQKLAVLHEMPECELPHDISCDYWFVQTFWNETSLLARQARHARNLIAESDGCSDFDDEPDAPDRPRLEEILKDFNPSSCQELCRQAALANLPALLFRFLCEPQSPLRRPWYFPDLPAALIELMEMHAQAVASTVPLTAITRQINEAFEFASNARTLVRIEADGRFLEEETIRALCQARPGRIAPVETPCENSDLEFFRALAKALGFDSNFKSINAEMRAKIVAVAQSCRFLFVFLNAQHLFPARFSSNTPPMRLSWIKTRLLDHRVPVAFVANKRQFEDAAKRFTKATKRADDHADGHPLDDLLKMQAMTFVLPAKLDKHDLFALARSRFPASELGDRPLKIACARSMMTPDLLCTVEKIIGFAQVCMNRDGPHTITEADIVEAAARVIPVREQRETTANSEADAPQPPADSRPAARPLPIPARATTPAPATSLESPARQTSPLPQRA